MNSSDQFLKNKVAEMRRVAPDCDIWLFPEAQGYTAYGAIRPTPMPLQDVNNFIECHTSEGFDVALMDRVSLGQHGGWRTILIAKLPATKKVEAEGDFA